MEENFKLHPHTEIPERKNIDDVDYSHDVFIIDEDNCKGVAFYKHSKNEWIFHTEHIFDELKFKWFYGPDVEN